MRTLIATRISLILALLVGATLLSWFLDQGQGSSSSQYASIAILIIAFVKVRFVITEFMEARIAPLPLKLLADGWCVSVCTLLIALLLIAA